ncbi:hypothetical protein [Amycolatopsis rifamycinica]|uniref:Uncharacterized protein n=1 Tax=Amycolatopsis rifamycinica TaxID=287986 RepID=A0A066TZ17_9PSEU|nr:hypothetical protein [Amycolatopsis rifamycinica]KDN17193.1 hypothetical protein DV20_36785 [Amycolatopsis rifamycinica]
MSPREGPSRPKFGRIDPFCLLAVLPVLLVAGILGALVHIALGIGCAVFAGLILLFDSWVNRPRAVPPSERPARSGRPAPPPPARGPARAPAPGRAPARAPRPQDGRGPARTPARAPVRRAGPPPTGR